MIILPTWLITTPLEPARQNWGVRVVDQHVADVAPHPILLQRYPADEVWLAESQVLAPGFVDSHTHLYGVLAHGIPLASAPAGFLSFLTDFWWPMVEDQLDRDMVAAATEFNCAAMIASGITSFYDCLEAPHCLPGILGIQAEIVHRRGLRGILSFEATQRSGMSIAQLGLQENATFLQQMAKADGLVSGMMCFHTTFTCDGAFIRQAYELAEASGGLVQAHCSEGAYESQYTMEKFGLRPIHHYDRLGVLSQRSLLSQCVMLDPSEIELLTQRGARMTHMPLSNCEVGGGIAPLPELVDAGVRVGLGSDGYITDFFEVMRGAFLIHKARRQDPRVMPANLVWYLATEGGARALGLEHVGRLETGWQADLQLFQTNLPTPLQMHNLYDQTLLYGHAADVTATMVAGRILMRDGTLPGVDRNRILKGTRQAAERLWSSAKQ